MFGVEKVVITKDDWHFKWLKFVHFLSVSRVGAYSPERGYHNVDVVNAPKSICPYFWLLMFSFAVVMGASAVGIGILGLVVFGLLNLIVWIAHNLQDTLVAVGITVAFIVVIVGLAFILKGLSELISWVRDKRYHGDYYKEPRKPGIFKTYIKSKKEKVCPLVEYT